jgi:hypothetical protein
MNKQVDDVIRALEGRHYVGQLVRINNSGGAYHRAEGIVVEVTDRYIGVYLGEHSDGETVYFPPDSVIPLG